MDNQDDDLAKEICSANAGSVLAAAGCGKTEQIVRATEHGQGRRLILTHTHAGVDVLRRRLKQYGISSDLYRIDTIASWSLRYSASYPHRSKLNFIEPKGEQDWQAVYAAMSTLVSSGAITRILKASYSGVLVDEYQDCSESQHQVIVALQAHLPVCIFGDPLQAIFDFEEQPPVDWETGVIPRFPHIRTLTTPHRWLRYKNYDLARWLDQTRYALERGEMIDLCNAPSCVTWSQLPDDINLHRARIINACLSAMSNDGDLVVIADPKQEGSRAGLAQALGKYGFSNIEPIESKTVYAICKKLQNANGAKLLDEVLNLLQKCMSGTDRSEFLKAIESRKNGGKRGAAKFGVLIDIGIEIQNGAREAACLSLIDGFSRQSATNTFRKEMLHTLQAALKMRVAGDAEDLMQAVWYVQNKIRHAGRKIHYRSVGSTLLVKGLEFANVVVVYSPNMNSKDWYVALTRATHTIKVVSPQNSFTPSA